MALPMPLGLPSSHYMYSFLTLAQLPPAASPSSRRRRAIAVAHAIRAAKRLVWSICK
jgi:hypothetical protein